MKMRRRSNPEIPSRPRSNPEFPSRPPLPSHDYTGSVRDERGSINRPMLIELDRDRETGYGFSIRGGRELDLPIFVLRMADGGTAQRDGRLRVRELRVECNKFDDTSFRVVSVTFVVNSVELDCSSVKYVTGKHVSQDTIDLLLIGYESGSNFLNQWQIVVKQNSKQT